MTDLKIMTDLKLNWSKDEMFNFIAKHQNLASIMEARAKYYSNLPDIQAAFMVAQYELEGMIDIMQSEYEYKFNDYYGQQGWYKK